MDNELLIKISADAKNFKQALEDAKAKTEDLEGSLGGIAKASGIAFAALAAQVGVALKAFADNDASVRSLTASLQSQGIFTVELRNKYLDYAEAIQKTTGIEKEEIVNAQAVAQSFLHQVPITKELTQAIADLAVRQGVSLPAAAEELGKAIGNGSGMLLRQGLKFSETATEAERYAKTLEFVAVKAGGAAEAQNQGLGSIKGLQAAFHDTQIELGQRFAPAATLVIKALTDFLTPSKEAAGAAADFKAVLITTGLIITGLGAALPLVANGFLAVRAAVLALNLSLSATKLLLYGLGIGLVIGLLVELALHWETVSQRVILAVKGMVEFVSGAFKGLGKVLEGAFHLDSNRIKEGLDEIVSAFKAGVSEATAEIPKETEKNLEKQSAIQKKYADKEAAERAELEETKHALAKAENDYVTLELQNASDKQLSIKKKEIETLKALSTNQNVQQRALLQARYKQLLADEEHFSVAYTTIISVLNSSEVKGTKQATGELVQLTNSKNETLKGIGKAAAVAQITIKTAESAMNIYEGFSAIPFIGPALGAIAAAAAVAYGAEQIGTVLAANQGGLVSGGVPGLDSVPALLTPGELIVPEKNFGEVIDSVAASRGGGNTPSGAPQSANIEITLKGDAMNFIEAKLVERQALNISLQRKRA